MSMYFNRVNVRYELVRVSETIQEEESDWLETPTANTSHA